MTDDLDTAALTEAFEYLDDLRESGRTNMWAASNFVVRELKWERAAADAATGLWMDTFAVNKTTAERVALASEQAA